MIKLEKQELENLLETMSPFEIAEVHQCSPETIRRKIRKFGIKRSRHSHKINEHFFEEWSNDMAYIVGFVFSDGSINTSLHHNKLVFSISTKDEAVLEFIASKIQPSKSIYRYSKINKSGSSSEYSVLDLSSKILVDSLNKLGCFSDKTHKDMSFPTNIPKEFIASFLLGLFDGDGSCGVGDTGKKWCYICNNCLSFIQEIRDTIGFGCVSENDIPPRIYFWSKSDMKKFYNLIYINTSSFYLERKFKRLEENINE
jgi:hypothetical protein